MQHMNIKLLPAEYGDCIFISFTGEQHINILIDGGTATTYKAFIKQEVDDIKEHGQRLDLIICTHMDSDHVGGLVKLLDAEETKNIGGVWYNGFLQIVDQKYYTLKENKYTRQDNGILDEIINRGISYSGEQNIGINECMAFGTLLEEKRIEVNSIVNGNAMCTENIKNTIKFTKDLSVTIIGPSKENLQELEEFWSKEMISRNYRFRVSDKIKLTESFEYLLEQIKLFYANERTQVSEIDELEKYMGDLNEIDNSVTNKSSISFIIHFKNEKYLFLGDSVINDDMLNNIEIAVGYEYRFAAIKLPHHGSRYNITKEFIERYKAKEYYCLTNSKRFKHPDLEVISTIICSDPNYKTIVFNYPIDKVLVLDNCEWKEKYNYEVVIGTGVHPIERKFQ